MSTLKRLPPGSEMLSGNGAARPLADLVMHPLRWLQRCAGMSSAWERSKINFGSRLRRARCGCALRVGAYDQALESLHAALEAEQSIGFRSEEAGIRTSQLLGDALSTELALADLVALYRASGDEERPRSYSINMVPWLRCSVGHFPVALQIQIGALA